MQGLLAENAAEEAIGIDSLYIFPRNPYPKPQTRNHVAPQTPTYLNLQQATEQSLSLRLQDLGFWEVSTRNGTDSETTMLMDTVVGRARAMAYRAHKETYYTPWTLLVSILLKA